MDYEMLLERYFEYQNKKKSEDLRHRRPNIQASKQLQIDLMAFRSAFSLMLGEIVQDKQNILPVECLAHPLSFDFIRPVRTPRPTCDQLFVQEALQIVEVRGLPECDPYDLRKCLPDVALADEPARDHRLADASLHAPRKSQIKSSASEPAASHHATEADAGTRGIDQLREELFHGRRDQDATR